MVGVMTRENLQVEVAVLISVVLHFVAFTSWRLPVFAPLAKLFRAPHVQAKAAHTPMQTITFVDVSEPAPKVSKRDEARTFMETDATQVTGEEPKEAKLYADKPT